MELTPSKLVTTVIKGTERLWILKHVLSLCGIRCVARSRRRVDKVVSPVVHVVFLCPQGLRSLVPDLSHGRPLGISVAIRSDNNKTMAAHHTANASVVPVAAAGTVAKNNCTSQHAESQLLQNL